MLGQRFRTGDKVLVSGVYRLVPNTFGATAFSWQQKEIPLSRGETFPPVRGINQAVNWQLTRLA